MANSKHKLDREEIMSFLLGELDEAETSRVESMFLSDPTYSEAIEAAKSKLFQDYKSGRLSSVRSGSFERRLLPELDQEREKFEAMLERNEQQRSDAPTPAGGALTSTAPSFLPTPAPETMAQGRGASLPPMPDVPKSNPLPKIIALVVVLAGAGAAFALTRGDSEKVVETATLSVFSVRGKSQDIILPKGEEVALVLPLPTGTSAETFSITLFHGDEESSLTATLVAGSVRATVFASKLQEGRYDLELRGTDASGANSVIGYYAFQK